MNKNLKRALIGINIVSLLVACYWLYCKPEPEPITVILACAATLASLIFEKQASRIVSRRIDNADIDIDVTSGDEVKTERITNSTIKVKSK